MEKKVLLVPDVHGRSFWKKPVIDTLENDVETRVVFLGDYFDCYPDEEDVSGKKTFDMFKDEILPLKKEYKGRVTLLLGNHDLGYYDSNICSCRSDESRRGDIEKLLLENWELFQLADEETINDKHFIFSHAGIHKAYAESCFENVDEKNVVDQFNNAFLIQNYGIMDSLRTYSWYRGWGGLPYGSIVWADVREWLDKNCEQPYGYQIFGHTRLDDEYIGKPFVRENFAMLDCRCAFYLDDEGKLRRCGDDELMEQTKNEKNDK